ncbi:hypothetical protein [Photobacterium sanguinicancri]|uniref:hypothetical protein n=1 Tax=Photobacterium sanguinicancri TaxID=875932 RepID=UPI0007895758|nr:hypothetical protein [Photobacterium sanguinicancri]KXI21925.1 hypothetical protein AS132_17120 [Photobacterium sanguinicancri]
MKRALVLGVEHVMGSCLCESLTQHEWDVLGVVSDTETTAPILGNLTLAELLPEDLDFLYQLAEEVDTVFFHQPYESDETNAPFSLETIITLCENLKLQLVITTNQYDFSTNWLPSLAFWRKKNPIPVSVPSALLQRLEAASSHCEQIHVVCLGHTLDCRNNEGYLGLLIKETDDRLYIQSPSAANLQHHWTYLPDLASSIATHLTDCPSQANKGSLHISYYAGHEASIADIAHCLTLSSGKPVFITPLPWLAMDVISLFSPLFRRFMHLRTLWQQGIVTPRSHSLSQSSEQTPLALALSQSWRKKTIK